MNELRILSTNEEARPDDLVVVYGYMGGIPRIYGIFTSEDPRAEETMATEKLYYDRVATRGDFLCMGYGRLGEVQTDAYYESLSRLTEEFKRDGSLGSLN